MHPTPQQQKPNSRQRSASVASNQRRQVQQVATHQRRQVTNGRFTSRSKTNASRGSPTFVIVSPTPEAHQIINKPAAVAQQQHLKLTQVAAILIVGEAMRFQVQIRRYIW